MRVVFGASQMGHPVPFPIPPRYASIGYPARARAYEMISQSGGYNPGRKPWPPDDAACLGAGHGLAVAGPPLTHAPSSRFSRHRRGQSSLRQAIASTVMSGGTGVGTFMVLMFGAQLRRLRRVNH